MSDPSLRDIAVMIVAIYATLAVLIVGAWRLRDWLDARSRRRPVVMIAPIPVAHLHRATKWRRSHPQTVDPLRTDGRC